MASDFQKFTVGQEEKNYYVHKDLVAAHSTKLGSMMESSMREGLEKCIKLEETATSVFEGFLEFIYTGDYQVPAPVIKAVEDAPALDEPLAEEPPAEGHSWEAFVGSFPTRSPTSCKPKRKGKKNKRATNSWSWRETTAIPDPLANEAGFFQSTQPQGTTFIKQRSEHLWANFVDQVRPTRLLTWEPRRNSHPSEDYTDVFLCHAELYVFADIYEASGLGERALQKLQHSLSVFDLHEQRVSDIAELVEYVYSNTAHHSRGIDRMREVLAHYCACSVEKLVASDEFRTVMEEKGSVAVDLLRKLVP